MAFHKKSLLLMIGDETASSAVLLVIAQVTKIDFGVSSRPSLDFQDIIPYYFRSFRHVLAASQEIVKLRAQQLLEASPSAALN